MSARGRKSAQATLPGVVMRDELNYYATPADVTRAIIPHLRRPGWVASQMCGDGRVEYPPPASWIDPGCGRGEIASELRAAWPEAQGWCVEIEPGRADRARTLGLDVCLGDWLGGGVMSLWDPDVIVTNGPFAWPEELRKHMEPKFGDLWSFWVAMCLERVADGGEVAALGRLGVLQGAPGSRRDCLFGDADARPGEPWDVYALSWRPSFNGNGTDSTPYGWFVFGPTRTYTIRRLSRPVRRG